MRAVVALVALMFAAGCTPGSDAGPEVSSTTSTSLASSTTTSEVVSSTTVSPEALRVAAKEEIEAAIVGWWTYAWDTSLGEAGLPLEFVTGDLEERLRDVLAARTAAGEIQRSRGAEAVEVTSITVDLDAGRAEIEVCTRGDGEVVDAETGEVLGADDGDSWEGQAFAELTDEGWRVSDFYTDEENGGNQCVLGG